MENFDPNEILNQLDFENRGLQSENMELGRALASGGFSDQEDQNLIQYQLETDKILERIKHFLRGDQIKFGKEGSYYSEPMKNILAIVKKDEKSGMRYFIQEIKERDPEKKTVYSKEILVKIINKNGDEIDIFNKDSSQILDKLKNLQLINQGYKYLSVIDEDQKPLNEYGVAELMRIISMYVTKETFLSYYPEERINEIMGDLGDKLNDFLYCNYEKMGMDTKFKESKYSLIILNILHVIESCYRRALDGGEQENIRTRAIVTQNNSLGRNNAMRRPQIKEKWNPLKPSTW